MASSSSSSAFPEVLGKRNGLGAYRGKERGAEEQGDEEEVRALAAGHDLERLQQEVGSSKVAGACKRTIWRLFLLGLLFATFLLGRLSKQKGLLGCLQPAAPLSLGQKRQEEESWAPAAPPEPAPAPAPDNWAPAPAPAPRLPPARPLERAPTPLPARSPEALEAASGPAVLVPRPAPSTTTTPTLPTTTTPRAPRVRTRASTSRSTTAWSTTTWQPRPTTTAQKQLVNATMRLIVNSHVRYWKPLNLLLQSLVHIKFEYWDQMVIFMGGSTREIPPHKGLKGWVPGGITIANLTLNNYDYNGLAGIYRYRHDPAVRADTYFYIHDSTSAGPNFNTVYPTLRKGFWPGELRIPRPPCSNIYTFAHSLVVAYRRNFDVNLSKGEAVNLELGGAGAFIRGVRPLLFFAKKTTWISYRHPRPNLDIYKTGVPRHVFWYQDFDLFKYILWGFFGDIGGDGKVHPNFR